MAWRGTRRRPRQVARFDGSDHALGRNLAKRTVRQKRGGRKELSKLASRLGRHGCPAPVIEDVVNEKMLKGRIRRNQQRAERWRATWNGGRWRRKAYQANHHQPVRTRRYVTIKTVDRSAIPESSGRVVQIKTTTMNQAVTPLSTERHVQIKTNRIMNIIPGWSGRSPRTGGCGPLNFGDSKLRSQVILHS